MAESHTRKKSTTSHKKRPYTVKQLNAVTDLVSDYLTQWTKEESRRLLHTESTPLIISVKNGYKVGRFNITVNPGQVWTVTDINNEKPIDFAEKRSAVLYCILYQTKNYIQAQNILIKDQTYSKLHTDFLYYEHCIRRAIKRGDMFVVDVTVARYGDTKHKLEVAKNDLQKTLNQAKYIKIWENRK
jgi:hypothetical protein